MRPQVSLRARNALLTLLCPASFWILFTAAQILMGSGAVPKDKWEWYKIKPYLVYVGMFVATIYTNMRALQHSNVETVIVFRSACPLIVSVLDWAFLGRQLPSARSIGALLVIIGGCIGYVLTDRAFKLNGWGAYSWVTAYFLIISVEMAYGKHIVGPHLAFGSMWGPTLYTNTLSIAPMLSIGLMAHEGSKIERSVLTPTSIGLLVSSCVIGVAISYLGWRARSLVTATCYTVLGVANKMFTVLANAMVWDQRASLTGVLFLVVCLVGAAGYKQAPLAEVSPKGEGDKTSAARALGRKQGVIVVGLAICGLSAFMFTQASSSATAPPSLVPVVPPSAAPYHVATPISSLGSDDQPSAGPSGGYEHHAGAHRGGAHHSGGHGGTHDHTHNHTHRAIAGGGGHGGGGGGGGKGGKGAGAIKPDAAPAGKAVGRGLGARVGRSGGGGGGRGGLHAHGAAARSGQPPHSRRELASSAMPAQ